MDRRFLCVILMLICAVSLSACQSAPAFTPDYERAIGVILVNSSQELPENEKVYAAFSDHQYLFHLDAAAVYYFNASADTAYAGDENFADLTFAAHIDEGTTGAQGTVCYWTKDHADNMLDVYYIYHDETGVYFESGRAVEHVFVGLSGSMAQTVSLSDFPCAIAVTCAEPVQRFIVTCYDENGAVIMSRSRDAQTVEDGENVALDKATASVSVEKFSDSGKLIGIDQITKENIQTTICCEGSGQVLCSKIIRFLWDEE